MRAARLLALALVALGGCVRYVGGAKPVSPEQLTGEGWIRVADVEVVRQRTGADCGVAAAAMVAERWQGDSAVVEIMKTPVPPYPGLRAPAVQKLLTTRGLPAFVIAGRFTDLDREVRAGRPVIVGTVKPQNDGLAARHYEVVVAMNRASKTIVTLDPKAGWRKWTYAAFDKEWTAARRTTIVVPEEATASPPVASVPPPRR
jgi:ABC-type bacteriocin/lantibiotic exporter with double-glycine peptidase domain